MSKPVAGRILIAGGGIGGMALALALARHGRESLVLEARAELGTEGAGIQIGPNGVRVLQSLGVADALQPLVGIPQAVHVYRGATGHRLAQLPLGQWIAERHGAPYWVVHRGDLHRVLHEAAIASGKAAVRTGSSVAGARQDSDGVCALLASGEEIRGDLLIGADGLWSSLRGVVAPGSTPVFANASATRAVLPASDAGRLGENTVGLWLTPGVHVVHYPVRGGAEIAVVVIAHEVWQSREWDTNADRYELLSRLSGFHADLVDVLSGVRDWRRWALYRLAPLPRWSVGPVTLIGDAAHPMLPYLAQGGVLALEDAFVLAQMLRSATGNEPQALAQFEASRRQRAARIQAASLRNGWIYHLAPPFSLARDAAFAAIPSRWLMAGFDWLYGWRSPLAH